MNSTHKAEIVPVALEKHENADSLSVVRVYGYSCVVRTADWQGITRGVYIPPDSLVDTKLPIFSFLQSQAKTDGWARIKAKRLRGVWSYGLLVPVPAAFSEDETGTNLAVPLCVKHYEPPEEQSVKMVDAEREPVVHAGLGKYDIDAFLRYKDVFVLGEPVIMTEKIHGANARFTFSDDRMYCGSRSQWKKEDDGNNPFWRQLTQYPGIRAFCETHPHCILYGEIYGYVQDLRYGVSPNEIRFAAFDIMTPGRNWLRYAEFKKLCDNYCIPTVPFVGSIPYSFEDVMNAALGNSLIVGADHIREGVVVKPENERWCQETGRVILKAINPAYLDR
jgi:RNA ligase (TIGR02306 family)